MILGGRRITRFSSGSRWIGCSIVSLASLPLSTMNVSLKTSDATETLTTSV